MWKETMIILKELLSAFAERYRVPARYKSRMLSLDELFPALFTWSDHLFLGLPTNLLSRGSSYRHVS
jgi:hypothetical protein